VEAAFVTLQTRSPDMAQQQLTITANYTFSSDRDEDADDIVAGLQRFLVSPRRVVLPLPSVLFHLRLRFLTSPFFFFFSAAASSVHADVNPHQG
jgi:hypothetical protein